MGGFCFFLHAQIASYLLVFLLPVRVRGIEVRRQKAAISEIALFLRDSQTPAIVLNLCASVGAARRKCETNKWRVCVSQMCTTNEEPIGDPTDCFLCVRRVDLR